MLKRSLTKKVLDALSSFPVVAILGCRQVGKTTLAFQVKEKIQKPAVYLDLELPQDRAKFSEPQLYLEQQAGKLLILDEIQRVPDLFPVMRSLIDQRRRKGEKSAHYLILGSASPELLNQSSESLAGRIAYLELDPFNIEEIETNNTPDPINQLWVRGGFPDSFLSKNDNESMWWREQFIKTYLERDLPQLGPKLSADKTYRLWKMLAFEQGCLFNASRFALSLEMSVASVKNYLEVLADLFLVRFLRPWSGNSKKRLIKSPKVYVRDSGLLHALTNITTLDDLISRSLCGLSWEGFAIEQILQKMTYGTQAFFYRSNAGSEIDLILELPNRKKIAIEIKRTLSPNLSKGFRLGCEEVNPEKRFFIIPRGDAYPLDEKTIAIGLAEFIHSLNTSDKNP
jgi:uncharacterized protein